MNFFNVDNDKFRFPSNGKAFLNCGILRHLTISNHLFRFPSNGKAFLNYSMVVRFKMRGVLQFRFPSNGKAFLNVGIDTGKGNVNEVSIPFKREGVSEPLCF